MSRSQDQPGGGSVWPSYRGSLGCGGDGLAGLDGSMYGVGSAGRLGQTAFFLVIQV